tara:strand:+ start:111 stop:563 length:453 start_codon:yes stop_codon:yes gene_type:complete
MNKNISLVLGCLLILAGFFWGTIKNVIPKMPDSVPAIVIQKPKESLINQWSPVSQSINDNNDKLVLCLFNKEFAGRILGYDATAQEVNDVYVFSAKEVFGDSLKGKYEDLSSSTKNAMVGILGKENHDIAETEKIDLSETFMGFAWCLNN